LPRLNSCAPRPPIPAPAGCSRCGLMPT
jgi:hypothetical protein